MKVQLVGRSADVAHWIETNWASGVTELEYTQPQVHGDDSETLHFPQLPPSIRKLSIKMKTGYYLTMDVSPDLEELHMDGNGMWKVNGAYFEASKSLRVLKMAHINAECTANSGTFDMRGSSLQFIEIDLDWDLVPLLPWTARHVDFAFCNLGPETFATRPALQNLLVSAGGAEGVVYEDISYESMQSLLFELGCIQHVISPNAIDVLPNHRPGMTVYIGLEPVVDMKEALHELGNISGLIEKVVICFGHETPDMFTKKAVYVYKTKSAMRRDILRQVPHATVEFVNIDKNNARLHFKHKLAQLL